MNSDFCDKFAIAGIGSLSRRMPGFTSRAFQAEAARLAIADAGLCKEDIDICIDPKRESAFHTDDWTDSYSRVLGVPAKLSFSVSRGATTAMLSIIMGAKLLELGIARHVLVAVGCNDWSTWKTAPDKAWGGENRKPGLWGQPLGEVGAVSLHSMFASRHMHEFGTTSRQLGAVAVAMRQWACLNPEAQMCDRPIGVEDHQNSPMVCWPYRLLDMCLLSDGGTAFVMTTAERARDLRRPPVYIMGVGLGDHARKMWWDKTNYSGLDVAPARDDAFRQAGIRLEDIDLAQLYDCFTAEVIFQLEGYGWCGKGEGGAFVEAGNIGPGGSLPVNTGGGLLSSHHHGEFTGLAEAVTQLRGDAGRRQVDNAEIALVTGHGGEILLPGMCTSHGTLILRR